MFLMVVADGQVAEAEREVLRGATRTLTDNAIRTAHIEKLFEECIGRAKQGVPARLEAVAGVLKADPALCESAFSLAAAIWLIDGR